MIELPTGWSTRRLGELGRYINGMAFKPTDWTTEGLPIIRIQNLTDPSKPCNHYDGDFKERYRLKDGDLLISWSASLGAFIWDRGPALLNQHIFRVEINERAVTRDFLYFTVLNALDRMKAMTHGSTMRHITKKKFEAMEVPIPPLDEQRRVVDRIREALNRVDEIQVLRSQSFRAAQAVGASARFEAFSQLGEPVPLESVIGSGPTNGLYKPAKYYGNGTRILRINDFNGGDSYIGKRVLRRLELTPSEQTKFALSQGDIVINRVNGSLDVVGKACLIAQVEEPLVFESNMMRLSVDSSVADPRFVLHFLASPQCREQIKRKARVINQASVNQQDVKSLMMPVPPLDQQRRVSDQLDEYVRIGRSLVLESADVNDAIHAVPAAVLRRAFAGAL